MKTGILAMLVVVIAVYPSRICGAEVTRFHSMESGVLSEEERLRWDFRLRRWLEDRRVATAAKPGIASEAALAPWRALLRSEGEPWKELAIPLARRRAVEAAWQAFRAGRRARAEEILEALSRRGPAEPLAVPWDWSDADAFLPVAEAFASRLTRVPAARCHWRGESESAVWIDGVATQGSVPLAEGLHAILESRDGSWRVGSVRCLRTGLIQASPLAPAPALLPQLPVASTHPAVLSVWSTRGVEVAWISDNAVHLLTEEPLDRSVALDSGGGPLAGLHWPETLARLPSPRPVERSERGAETPESPSGATKSSSWGLWVALGAAVALGAGVYLSQRENARQGLTMPVKWD